MGTLAIIPRQAIVIGCLLVFMVPLACCGGPGVELPPSEWGAGGASRA